MNRHIYSQRRKVTVTPRLLGYRWHIAEADTDDIRLAKPVIAAL
jgi:hypothetical protein